MKSKKVNYKTKYSKRHLPMKENNHYENNNDKKTKSPATSKKHKERRYFRRISKERIK